MRGGGLLDLADKKIDCELDMVQQDDRFLGRKRQKMYADTLPNKKLPQSLHASQMRETNNYIHKKKL